MDFVKKEWHFRDVISESELNRMEDGIEEGITKAEQAQGDISAHATRTDNPHAVTKAQVGLGSVQNYGVASQAQAEAGSANNVYMTPLRTKQAIDINLNPHLMDYVRQPGYAVTGGSGNAYTITISPAPSGYVDGMGVVIRANRDNTGASTINVNGLGAKSIKKPNGNDVAAGNLKAGSIYTLRYNAATENFILQGEGGSGNAQPDDVLSGKTFTNDNGEQVGTMPNRGGITITPGTSDQSIPLGYHDGTGKVIGDPDLVSANIRSGANIFGVAGKASVVDTADANAVAGDILSGKTAYVNGAKVTGNIPVKGDWSLNNGVAYYDAGSEKGIRVTPERGYYDGTNGIVKAVENDLIPSNIRQGVNIFGVVGNLQPKNAGDISVGDTVADVRLLPLSGGMGAEIWANTEVMNGWDVAVDSAGNVYCAHSVSTGAKAIRKLNSSGAEVWAKTDVAQGRGVAVDSAGNVYCANDVNTGKSIRKLNNSGTEIWANTAVPQGYGVAVDSAGNVYCAHSVTAGNKSIRKLNSSGTEIWAKTDVAQGRGIAVDSAGNVYCAHNVSTGGKAIRKLDSSGNEIWSKTDVGFGLDIAVDSSGNVYCAHHVSSGKTIRKLNSSGTEIWAKADVLFGFGIAVDSAGSVYCAHDVSGGNKAIRKLDIFGNEIWAKTDVPYGRDIAVDSAGNVYSAHAVGIGEKGIRKLDGNRYFKLLG